MRTWVLALVLIAGSAFADTPEPGSARMYANYCRAALMPRLPEIAPDVAARIREQSTACHTFMATFFATAATFFSADRSNLRFGGCFSERSADEQIQAFLDAVETIPGSHRMSGAEVMFLTFNQHRFPCPPR